MKKVTINKAAVKRAVDALDEIETGVLGRKIAFRTDIRAGAEGDTCKPWMCAQPLYGVTPLPDLL